MDWDPLFVVIIDICLLPISSAHTAEKSKTFSEGEIATVIGFSAKVIKEVQIGGNVCRRSLEAECATHLTSLDTGVKICYQVAASFTPSRGLSMINNSM